MLAEYILDKSYRAFDSYYSPLKFKLLFKKKQPKSERAVEEK